MGEGLIAVWLAALLVVEGVAAESDYYRVEDIAPPKDAVLEVGGITYTPDGTLYVCTRRGEIWAQKNGAWSLFATGLHEPLGLLSNGNGDLTVAQRPELTRVRDTDGDGTADSFEALTEAFGVTGNYHEYHFGPVRDRKGNLYATLNLGHHGSPGHVMGSQAKYRGWAYKLTPKGEFIPYAVGFRSPAGIGVAPDGELFVLDNQGDWMATSPVFHLKANAFYGHPEGLKSDPGYHGPEDPCALPKETLAARRTLPAAWFPYGVMGHSPSEPVWDTTGGKFGPFTKQMLVGDQTKSFVVRVALEKVKGEYQGAAFPFRRGFGSGITRMSFAPDHTLLVGGTDRGWGAIGGKGFALQRVVWTGKMPLEVHEIRVTPKGFDLTFTKPVDRAALTAASFAIKHYGYNYWATYGSPQVEPTAAPVAAVNLSSDGRRASLTLPKLVIGRLYEFQLRGVKATDGTPLLHGDAYYTLNRVP